MFEPLNFMLEGLLMESTKNLPELINAVTSELLRLRYSPVTISKCNAVWQKLLSYTQAKDLLHFSEKLSESFLLEYYKYPADYSGEFPYGTRIALRAVRMLGDYQLYGIILRKRKSSNHRARMDLQMQYAGLFCIPIKAEIQLKR